MKESLYNGSYTGPLTSFDDRDVCVTETVGAYTEEHEFPLSLVARVQLEEGDFQLGDVVTLFVEFNNYTCVGLQQAEMNPRALHERLLVIERQLGIRDDG